MNLDEKSFPRYRLTIGNCLEGNFIVSSLVSGENGFVMTASRSPVAGTVLIESVYRARKEKIGEDQQAIYKLFYESSQDLDEKSNLSKFKRYAFLLADRGI